MIYQIVQPAKQDNEHIYIKPLYCIDAWDAYKMLDNAFPYNEETHIGNAWQFFICCFAGYENCLQFKVS